MATNNNIFNLFYFNSIVKMLWVLNCAIFYIPNTYAQPVLGTGIADGDLVIYRVIHTANTADIDKEIFYQNLQSHFALISAPFSLVLNGDLVNENISTDTAKLHNLVNTLSGFVSGQAILLSGDRDWGNTGENGWQQVEMLEKLIKSFNINNVKWAIENGCPGPKVFTLHNNLLLVTINTQWWNHPFQKPQTADGTCNISTEDDFFEELKDILDENEDKHILIAGHFPLISFGEYGGHIPPKIHLFPLTSWNKQLYIPLPIIGSFYAAYRQNIGTPKDIHNECFEAFKNKMQAILSERNNLIYLSGHEHNLEIIQENTNYFINSGSPQEARYVVGKGYSRFSQAMPGIIEILYYSSGKVVANVYYWSSKTQFTLQSIQVLYQPVSTVQQTSIPVNYQQIPSVEEARSTYVVSQQKPEELAKGTQLVPVAAGPEYKADRVKKLIWGKHYRDSWTAQVHIPYLNLDTVFNGLQVIKKGGSRQTTSLKFKAPDEKEYVFRSVNKDPAKALNYQLRETIISRILRDQTSTQHPYGAMVADILLNETEILHAHPHLYVLPDDKKLGPFRREFAYLLGMLEEKPSVPKKSDINSDDPQKIIKSYQLFRELYNNPHSKIDAAQFAKARMFDILVGDWGKHEDNWKWAAFKQEKGLLYKPIPRDRDHVFSRWDGLIPWLADRKWAKPSGENFGYTIKDIRSLTWQSRHLDRFLASELTQLDWLDAAKSIQANINNEVIEKAVANIPSEVQLISGEEISSKLKSRIEDLDKYALTYYKILARYVDVVGSNENDHFQVIRHTDGSVEVLVFEKDKTGRALTNTPPLYHRTFYPSETKEVRLYGLNGKDVFTITGESKKSIKLRVIGGPGRDYIADQSVVRSGSKKTLIYEQSHKSEIRLGQEGKSIHHPNEVVYNYNRTAFAYPTYFPSPYVSYNQYNGIELNMGLLLTGEKFGKQDYSTKHHFRASASTRGNFVFRYGGRFRHVIRKWDVELEGIFARPDNYNFFFGLGNETIKNNDLFNTDFYVTRYNHYSLGSSLIRDFWKKSSFLLKATYNRYAGEIDAKTILSEKENFFGIAPLHMLESEASLDLDFRDNPSLPNKGMRLWISHQNGFITNHNYSNYGITRVFIEHYSGIGRKFPLTLGLKAGAGDTYGEIPFYKQLILGQLNDLRGYVRHRFTGNTKVFFNSELRLQLLDVQTSIVPIKLGIKGFYDVGKVYVDNEKSRRWHKGYGGGIYLVPINESFTCSASLAFSREENAFLLINIGHAF